MKKLRILICALVVLSMAAASVFCMGAALPEGSEMVLDLLPTAAGDVDPYPDHDDRYDPSVEDGSYSMTLLAAGANPSPELTSFAASIYEIGAEVNINEAPNIRFKSHFTNATGESDPRVNLAITFTSAGTEGSIRISDLTDVFDVAETKTGAAIITDQEKTINFYELVDSMDMLPSDGIVTIDRVTFFMGGDEGLVLTYDYLYFEKGTPTINGEEVTSTAPVSSAASVSSSTPGSSTSSSTPASSQNAVSPNYGDDENADLVLYIVIGVAAALIVIGIVVFIIVKSKKSDNGNASPDTAVSEKSSEENADAQQEEKSEDSDKKE